MNVAVKFRKSRKDSISMGIVLICQIDGDTNHKEKLKVGKVSTKNENITRNFPGNQDN